VQRQLSAHQRHQVSADRQTETGADIAATAGTVGLHECLEYPDLLFRSYANPGESSPSMSCAIEPISGFTLWLSSAMPRRKLGLRSRVDRISKSASALRQTGSVRYHAGPSQKETSMLLQLQTWPAVESYLKTRRDIIMPIGSTEQHGPNGLIGTDAITAEVVAHAVAQATGALVAPTIAVGMAQHHLAFPGSMALRPSTLIALIRDCVESLALHGFEHFFFINGHGGNVATTQAAFSEIHANSSFAGNSNGRRLRLALHNWYEAQEVGLLSRELYGDQEGSHATPSEVSLTWHVHPQCAQPMTLDPAVAPRGSFGDAAEFRRNFPDGRIGSNPGLASAEHGGRILDAAVNSLAGRYRRWLEA